MAEKKCCVCGRNPVSECGWYPRCNADACKAIYHLCFSGVADGISAAKTADLEDLHLAFLYLQRTPHPQKTLHKALAREIGKRMRKADLKQNQSTDASPAKAQS
jgi:hypothetical protein